VLLRHLPGSASQVLRFPAEAARDVEPFHFHPGQSVERNADGALAVRFAAGDLNERCWLLAARGKKVRVVPPVRLRERLGAMRAALAERHESGRAIGPMAALLHSCPRHSLRHGRAGEHGIG